MHVKESVAEQRSTRLIHVDVSRDTLISLALMREEGVLAANQALSCTTGARTGRSPRDRFIVQEPETAAHIDWGNVNQPFAPEAFRHLWQRVELYLNEREHFISHLRVGADATHYLPVVVSTELAWHQLFAQTMLIRQEAEHNQTHQPWQILSAPYFQCDPARDGTNSEAAVILHLSERKILICGTLYAGELKKALFTVMNYLMPDANVLPMHCSANAGTAEGDDTVLFFGLSGTGKTTLSADPERFLIGDDEHGWSESGIFNFEGGCYAKCINLSQKNEPLIWNALRYGAILENVVLHRESLAPQYDDGSLSQNTRAAYPLEHISQRVHRNAGAPPKAVVFLTCDLFGVLPPVARLSHAQAAYYFLNGYTAHVGSTEVGSATSIKPTFSTCFGAAFFPRPSHVYAELLMKRLQETQAPVYLVNTGWFGGSYGEGGERFPIPVSRHIISAIESGELNSAPFQTLPRFNIDIPQSVPGVDATLLNPVLSWKDPTAYDKAVNTLIEAFHHNFQQHSASETIQNAAPV